MEGIDIQEYKVGALQDVVLLKASGFIDTNTSPELQKVMSRTIDGGNYQIIVDMAAVQYVSSAGWGVFVGEIRRLKEKGGDLKLTQMSPEVNEVFEMLEFNRILSSYDRLEEAIDDFDFYRDLCTLPSNGKPYVIQSPAVAVAPQTTIMSERRAVEPAMVDERGLASIRNHSASSEVDEKKLPVHEKVKKIVLENPLAGIWGIQKMLMSPRFGYTKLSFFELRALLKRLNLHTKAKRCRYYRSR